MFGNLFRETHADKAEQQGNNPGSGSQIGASTPLMLAAAAAALTALSAPRSDAATRGALQDFFGEALLKKAPVPEHVFVSMEAGERELERAGERAPQVDPYASAKQGLQNFRDLVDALKPSKRLELFQSLTNSEGIYKWNELRENAVASRVNMLSVAEELQESSNPEHQKLGKQIQELALRLNNLIKKAEIPFEVRPGYPPLDGNKLQHAIANDQLTIALKIIDNHKTSIKSGHATLTAGADLFAKGIAALEE